MPIMEKDNNNNSSSSSSSSREMDDTSFMRDFIADLKNIVKPLAHGSNDDDSVDLTRLVSSCRALIRTNEEIWDRCKPSLILDAGQQTGEQEPQQQQEEEAGRLLFYRVGYLELQVTTDAPGQMNRQVTFNAQSKIATESFPALPKIPSNISSFFHIDSPQSKDQLLLDYGGCVDKILFLKEDVSRLFLFILKDHLENVQVALGRIETWLWGHYQALSFLNETFGADLTQPESGNGCMANACYRTHGAFDLCLKCFRQKQDHSRGHYEAHPRCHQGGYASFFNSRSQSVKTIDLSSREDSYTMALDICSEQNQERVRRFLHFLGSPGTSPGNV